MDRCELIRNRWVELTRGYKGWALKLQSADYDGEYPPGIVLAGFGFFLWLRTLPIIPAYQEKVYKKEDPSQVWFTRSHQRAYGFSIYENFLNVFLGRQTDDSSTEQRWGYFFPWAEWRYVGIRWYDLEGKFFYSFKEKETWRDPGSYWDDYHAAEAIVPVARFQFKDYDGELIEVTTKMEERQWLRGEKWCSWLSYFFKPKTHRSLDLRFSKEVGPRKGSWKGGTLGHSIEMLPGELHEAAFRRYCAAHNLTFIGAL